MSGCGLSPTTEPTVEVGATEADVARNRAMGGGIVDDPYPVFRELLACCPVERGNLDQHFPNPDRRVFDGVGRTARSPCTPKNPRSTPCAKPRRCRRRVSTDRHSTS